MIFDPVLVHVRLWDSDHVILSHVIHFIDICNGLIPDQYFTVLGDSCLVDMSFEPIYGI